MQIFRHILPALRHASIRPAARTFAVFRKVGRRPSPKAATGSSDNSLAAVPPPPPPTTTLPAGWFEARSPEGRPYYYTADGRTQWEPPVPVQPSPGGGAMTMPGLPAPSQGGGLFQVVKEGLAFGVGNAVAHHAVSSIFNSFGGGGSAAPSAPPAASAPAAEAAPQSPDAGYDDGMRGFSDDDDSSGGGCDE